MHADSEYDISKILIYSGTSLSEGVWDGNFVFLPHSPVIICAKKAS